MRPEDGGAAPHSRDLVTVTWPPPPGVAYGPRVERCPAKRAQATLTDGETEAQSLGRGIEQGTEILGFYSPDQAFHTTHAPHSKAHSTQGNTSASQAQGSKCEAQDPPRKVGDCARHLASPSPWRGPSKASATLEEEFLVCCGHKPRISRCLTMPWSAAGQGQGRFWGRSNLACGSYSWV